MRPPFISILSDIRSPRNKSPLTVAKGFDIDSFYDHNYCMVARNYGTVRYCAVQGKPALDSYRIALQFDVIDLPFQPS